MDRKVTVEDYDFSEEEQFLLDAQKRTVQAPLPLPPPHPLAPTQPSKAMIAEWTQLLSSITRCLPELCRLCLEYLIHPAVTFHPHPRGYVENNPFSVSEDGRTITVVRSSAGWTGIHGKYPFRCCASRWSVMTQQPPKPPFGVAIGVVRSPAAWGMNLGATFTNSRSWAINLNGAGVKWHNGACVVFDHSMFRSPRALNRRGAYVTFIIDVQGRRVGLSCYGERAVWLWTDLDVSDCYPYIAVRSAGAVLTIHSSDEIDAGHSPLLSDDGIWTD